MSPSKLIVGCGYLGLRVGRLWRTGGHSVWAVTRSDRRVYENGMAGFLTAGADVTKPETLRRLANLVAISPIGTGETDAALFAVGMDRASGVDFPTVYAQGLSNVLAALPESVKRFIYISTTGVYGAAGGEWVDENTPPNPQRDGGRASLAAEQVLAAHPLGQRSVILRLAGIYGPGRVPYLDQLRRGEQIPAPSEGWLNLIHVDDAARVVVAADNWLAAQPAADGPHVFCVTDGSPVVRGDYYAEAARLLGSPPPGFCDPPPGSPRALRAAANRRVRNKKLREVLGGELDYPSYREGLAAILGDLEPSQDC